MLQLDFDGKVVIVTGGTKGIGRRICERFLELGADVLTCGRSEPEDLPTPDTSIQQLASVQKKLSKPKKKET